MQKEEMVVAIIALGCITAIVIALSKSFFSLINKWIDAKNGNTKLNEKFFDDYIAFKRDVVSQLDYLKTTGQIPAKTNLEQPEFNPYGEEEIVREAPRLKNMLSQKK